MAGCRSRLVVRRAGDEENEFTADVAEERRGHSDIFSAISACLRDLRGSTAGAFVFSVTYVGRTADYFFRSSTSPLPDCSVRRRPPRPIVARTCCGSIRPRSVIGKSL